jgi:hypothetical protein
MRFLAVWTAGLMAAVALAGCIGEGEQSGSGGATGPNVEFDESLGIIRGVVQTEDLLPVQGAQVGILETEHLAVTDEAGSFQLVNVEPGSHRVVAQALGFQSVGRSVDVVAGQAVEVAFQLGAVPTDAPYVFQDIQDVVVTAIMWKLTPECIYTDVNTLAKTCGGIRPDCSGSCELSYEDLFEDLEEAGHTWHSLIGEVAWEPQTGATGRGFNFDLNAPNIERGTGGSINQADPKTFVKDSDESPIIIRIDNPTTLQEREIPEEDWCCDWFYRIFAGYCDLGFCGDGFGPDYGVMVEGRATIYISVAVNGPVAPDYTALPDV